MTNERQGPTTCPRCSRRQLLRAGAGLAGGGAAALWLPGLVAAADPEPVPIPELDPNGHHNDPPGPGAEPAEIYHFSGLVARARLAGMGTDGQGNRIPFGSPGTDFGYMQGAYLAADGARQTGTFSHL